jgi:hypothetical protein
MVAVGDGGVSVAATVGVGAAMDWSAATVGVLRGSAVAAVMVVGAVAIFPASGMVVWTHAARIDARNIANGFALFLMSREA